MNVFQIVEQQQVRSNGDLAKAFNQEEWVRIVNHFVTSENIWGGSLGSDRSIIQGRMSRFNDMLGMNMTPGSQTTSNWVINAARYGIRFDRTNVTWQDIYNKLAPFATAILPPEYNNAGLADVVATNSDSETLELEFEMATWVNTDKTKWSDMDLLIKDFIKPWYNTLQTKRPAEWKAWLNQTGNRYLPRLRSLPQDRLAPIIEAKDSIAKEEVVRELFAWLQVADYAFENYTRIQNNQN
jgi:hypothetical protein